MSLHRQPDVADIHAVYESHGLFTSPNFNGFSPAASSSSERISTTQPDDSWGNLTRTRPPRVHHNTYDGTQSLSTFLPDYKQPQESPQSSSRSIASTVLSDDGDLDDYTSDGNLEDLIPVRTPSAIATTPSDFSELFPSHRELFMHHDDSTLDGNMNLRVDTKVLVHGGTHCNMTLFHLRLHDLRAREFSLRRYCRDSGRQVCHSRRKDQTATEDVRLTLSRTFSQVLQSVRPKPEQFKFGHKRSDSGYGSLHSEDSVHQVRQHTSDGSSVEHSRPSNLMQVEFSNYAQLDLKRTSRKRSRRYEFDYWGTQYAWKCVEQRHDGFERTSFHLVKAGSSGALAHVVPLQLSTERIEREQNKGGWIPACSMWITDETIVKGSKDIADVVVATGLMALVDNSIRTHFRVEHVKQSLLPSPKVLTSFDSFEPGRFFSEIFHHSSTSHKSNPSAAGQPLSGGAEVALESDVF